MPLLLTGYEPRSLPAMPGTMMDSETDSQLPEPDVAPAGNLETTRLGPHSGKTTHSSAVADRPSTFACSPGEVPDRH